MLSGFSSSYSFCSPAAVTVAATAAATAAAPQAWATAAVAVITTRAAAVADTQNPIPRRRALPTRKRWERFLMLFGRSDKFLFIGGIFQIPPIRRTVFQTFLCLKEKFQKK